ncbi:DUF6274 family protein [Streptomyces sp. AK04-4c]|uniref:DUF6274 family protein n=1 Tax=Streptomyces sp. AK04-4c TaxID=3028651 RepID=UPI0029AE40F1|nr:DUF6274 family protein [Streptomyces sp. AK04-4c]MDX3688625.1 DUF6274 family protein [Streptomyces sp. AK04-4c]
MTAPTERHETRALLRAHLAAASGYRHLTRHCPICHRLLRLAMEPLTAPQAPPRTEWADSAAEPVPAAEPAADDPGAAAVPEAAPAAGEAPATHHRVPRPGTSPGDESPCAT